MVTQWLVKVGDTVKEGDTLADIETDKADDADEGVRRRDRRASSTMPSATRSGSVTASWCWRRRAKTPKKSVGAESGHPPAVAKPGRGSANRRYTRDRDHASAATDRNRRRRRRPAATAIRSAA